VSYFAASTFRGNCFKLLKPSGNFTYDQGDLREGDHLRDPDVDGRIISKWNLKKWNGWAWTELIWLRIGTCGGLL
jgi:hypothetical protein